MLDRRLVCLVSTFVALASLSEMFAKVRRHLVSRDNHSTLAELLQIMHDVSASCVASLPPRNRSEEETKIRLLHNSLAGWAPCIRQTMAD